MAELNLSLVNPDFNDILVQLESYLSSLDSWKGVVSSQTGQGILNMIAAIGAFDQAKIRRKYEDSFPETVVSDEASYAIADMQGVRLTRKLPATVSATLTSPTSLTIPAYSTFQGSGGFFFNRAALFLTAGTPITVTLYEGQVQRYSMAGIDQEYAMFVSQESAFSVSDVDVSIKLDTTAMARTTGGLWTLKGQVGFADSTLPDGKLIIQFGTNTYGSTPRSTQTLYITYATTSGSDGNSLDTNGKNLTVASYGTVTGVFTSSPSGGANERSALSYKNLSASTFGVFDSAITRQQYITTALSYPGVLDVLTFAQREINPAAKSWMNLIKIVPITSSVWTLGDETTFMNWMSARTAYSPVFFVEQPVAVSVNIDLDVYCFNWANSTQAKANASAAITRLLSPRTGILGYDIHITDLTNAILKADPSIEYIQIRSPATDVIVSGSPVLAPTLVAVGGGTLVADLYYYSIAATVSGGVITTRNYSSIVVAGGQAVNVSWEVISGATNYSVYRGSVITGVVGLLASVGTAITYLDSGSVIPTTAPPAQNSVPVRYATLGTINVVDRYSTRSSRV